METNEPINTRNATGRGNDIEAIMAAPFIAASQANGMMAKEQTQFIIDCCFIHDGKTYQPITVQLALTRYVMEPGKGKNGEPVFRQVQTFFEVPLLSIIPISSLAIEEVDINFELEITSTRRKNIENNQSISKKNTGKVQLTANISYDSQENQQGKEQYRKKNTSKLQVSMKARPLPLPVGMTTILDLYTKNISASLNGATTKEDN